MQPSSDPVNVSRRFLILGIVVFAVAALYSAAWFVAAGKAKEYLAALLKTPGPDLQASCANMDIKGFPFRAGVYCDTASFANAVNGLKVETGAVRTMTLVYNPTKAIFEVDGPAKTALPGGATLDSNWESLDGSLHANTGGLTEVSVFLGKITAALGLAGVQDAVKLNIGHGEFHTRQNGANVDVAVMAQNNTVATGLLPKPLPLFSVSADLTINDRADLLRGGQLVAGEPVTGAMNRLALDFGSEGFLTLSGPFQIGADGLLSGDFQIDVENFAKLQPLLDASFPDSAPVIDASSVLIAGISKDGINGHVKLTVRSGAILVGIIPVGFIPPL